MKHQETAIKKTQKNKNISSPLLYFSMVRGKKASEQTTRIWDQSHDHKGLLEDGHHYQMSFYRSFSTLHLPMRCPWVWFCYSHTANHAQTNRVLPRFFPQKVMITLRPWHLKRPLAKSAHNSLLTLFITSRNDPILWEWGPASAQGPGNNSPH